MSFDRLLLPESILRQTFVLVDANNNGVSPVPTVAYDPVARVVTVTPADGSLTSGQPYKLVIVRPHNDADLNGLRTIDGATLSPDSPTTLGFNATDATTTPGWTTPTIDFCRDISPVLTDPARCGLCHGQYAAYSGLQLDTPANIQATALGRVANGSNTGPMAVAQPPLLQFAVDMPIIDPGPAPFGLNAANNGTTDDGGPAAPIATGDPGHSWLLYKVLMAVPPACDLNPRVGFAACDGGPPPGGPGTGPASIDGLYQVACSDAGDTCPQALPEPERQRLFGLVSGLEMPYPNDPAGPASENVLGLTVTELELFNLWIAQGAPMPSSCQ
jgi:hypothetical protein